MKRSVPNRKCVVLCLLSLAFGVVAAFGVMATYGVVAAFGGTGAKAPKPTGAEAYARRLTATKNRLGSGGIREKKRRNHSLGGRCRTGEYGQCGPFVLPGMSVRT